MEFKPIHRYTNVHNDKLNCYDYMYTGKKTNDNPERGLAHQVVCNLVSGLEHKGIRYHVFTDNFYSSPVLFRDLYQSGFEATGTVRTNRKGLSKSFQQSKLHKGRQALI